MKTASILKKTAAIAAIVGGAGLLAAPLEQAEAQVLSPSGFSGVTLECVHPSDATSGIVGISVDIHVFDTGAIVDPNDTYDVDVWWPWWGWDRIRNFGNSSIRTESAYYFFWPLPAGDYYTVKFYKVGDPDDCIKVVIWVGLDGEVSAMEYDSDGNSRPVDVTVE